MITRRRLIAIAAAMATLPAAARADARMPARLWTGQAMGARASIRIAHPEAEVIAGRVLAEIDRLENILSLYRADSALVRLNRAGHLEAPPFELLECLSLADAAHRASAGRFDATVQPLWALWAESAAAGRQPTTAEIDRARARTGWDRVRLDATRIEMAPGTALTLNGIGQGYVADRVAALLAAEGLGDILIDTGEFRALGGQPDGRAWQVTLSAGGSVGLKGRALATSAPLGTTFDPAGQDGHILDPRTGRPAARHWREISVSAPTAAEADALSTAACLTDGPQALRQLMAAFAGATLEAATAA